MRKVAISLTLAAAAWAWCAGAARADQDNVPSGRPSVAPKPAAGMTFKDAVASKSASAAFAASLRSAGNRVKVAPASVLKTLPPATESSRPNKPSAPTAGSRDLLKTTALALTDAADDAMNLVGWGCRRAYYYYGYYAYPTYSYYSTYPYCGYSYYTYPTCSYYYPSYYSTYYYSYPASYGWNGYYTYSPYYYVHY
jgi:hypothetical protein